MSVYLVTYELKDQKKDYSAFYEAIEKSGFPCRILETTWLVEPKDAQNCTVESLANELSTLINEKDEVFVVDITSSTYGAYLTHTLKNKWLKERVDSTPKA